MIKRLGRPNLIRSLVRPVHLQIINYSTEAKSSSDALKRQLYQLTIDKYVYEHGWTNEAIRAAATEMQLSPMALGMFDGGINQIILAYMENGAIYASKKYMYEKKQSPHTFQQASDVVKALLRYRLEYQAGFVKANMWSQAMGSIMLSSKTKALDSLQRFADEVSYHADEFESPENEIINYHKVDWYAKRIGVAGIYASAELFMLTDASDNFQDTFAFLDQLVDQAVKAKKVGEDTKTVFDMGSFMAQTYITDLWTKHMGKQ